MRLNDTIKLHAGGPGSGCNPGAGKCGRSAEGPNSYARTAGTLDSHGWTMSVQNQAGSQWVHNNHRGAILVRKDGRWLHIRSTPTSRGAEGPSGKDGESMHAHLSKLSSLSSNDQKKPDRSSVKKGDVFTGTNGSKYTVTHVGRDSIKVSGGPTGNLKLKYSELASNFVDFGANTNWR